MKICSADSRSGIFCLRTSEISRRNECGAFRAQKRHLPRLMTKAGAKSGTITVPQNILKDTVQLYEICSANGMSGTVCLLA